MLCRAICYQRLFLPSPHILAVLDSSKGLIMAKNQLHSTPNCQNLEEVKGHARKIFDAGVKSVLPDQMVKNCLKLQGNTLTVKNKSYKVDHNVHVVGFGKAVIGMVKAVDDILGDHIAGGVASIPVGIQEALKSAGKQMLLPRPMSKVKLIEGAKDNLPDVSSMKAANEIAGIASNLTDKDILIVLVSGGGSALLPCPVAPISLEEKLQVTKALAMKGATITELNTVRKNLSTLKGGGLAQLAYPAQVVTLILSDIIGDPLDLIASAPTVADASTPSNCLDIIKRLEVKDDIPKAVMKYLTDKAECSSPDEGQKTALDHVMNVIVGSNSIAVDGAVKEAEKCGYATMLYSKAVMGEAKSIGTMYTHLMSFMFDFYCAQASSAPESTVENVGSAGGQKEFQTLLKLLLRTQYDVRDSTLQKIEECTLKAAANKQPMCLIGAGETTVTVAGKGKGGRNQEMALSAAVSMQKSPIFSHMQEQGFDLIFLSAGTDGQDGPTNAAGAFAYPGQVTDVNQSEAKNSLEDNDSYSFYDQLNNGEDLLITGLTGTNVMDLQILLLNPPK